MGAPSHSQKPAVMDFDLPPPVRQLSPQAPLDVQHRLRFLLRLRPLLELPYRPHEAMRMLREFRVPADLHPARRVLPWSFMR